MPNLASPPKRTKGSGGRRPKGFLLWLSGADLGTLEQVPDEAKKFTGVGGVVLTTSIMATVSATFALYTGARAPIYAAVIAGVLWGLAIMNLDRWLVTATVRRDSWKQNLLIALPRVALALIIGIVISTPLVLWIFQREINAELDVIHQQKRAAFDEKLRKEATDKGIVKLREEIVKLQAIVDGTATNLVPPSSSIASLETEVKTLNDDYQTKLHDAECELDGTCGSHHKGNGPSYQFKLSVANAAKAKLTDAQNRLSAAKSAANGDEKTAIAKVKASAAVTLAADKEEVAAFEALQKAEQNQFNQDNSNDSGILARLDALSSLTNRSVTLKSAYLALLLFITAIEILPVITKFLMSLGEPTSYDKVLKAAATTREDTAKARFDYEKKIAERELEERFNREGELVPDLVDRMVKAEVDVYEEKIRQWRDTEMGRPGAPAGRTGRGTSRPTQPPAAGGRGTTRGGGRPATAPGNWPTPKERPRQAPDDDKGWGEA